MMRPETKKKVDSITDCFSGADGGVEFAKFLSLVTEMDQQAAEGDAAAEEILQIVRNFHFLIRVAQKVPTS